MFCSLKSIVSVGLLSVSAFFFIGAQAAFGQPKKQSFFPATDRLLWIVTQTDHGAKLVLGTERFRDIGIMFECAKGQSQIIISVFTTLDGIKEGARFPMKIVTQSGEKIVTAFGERNKERDHVDASVILLERDLTQLLSNSQTMKFEIANSTETLDLKGIDTAMSGFRSECSGSIVPPARR